MATPLRLPDAVIQSWASLDEIGTAARVPLSLLGRLRDRMGSPEDAAEIHMVSDADFSADMDALREDPVDGADPAPITSITRARLRTFKAC